MSGPSFAEPQLNATPLIDVLLVLLVMLIFTLPIATHAVKLNLPVPGPSALLTAPPLVRVDIDFDGQVVWNGEPVASMALLEQRLRATAAAVPAPRVKIVPDRRARYGNVAQVLAAAQRLHVSRLEVAPVAL